MKSICFYFQIHQPFRLKRYRFFDIGLDSYYYDDYLNRSIIQKIAEKSYLPANRILLDLIEKYGSDFKVSFSVSGIALEQFELYSPEVLESFQKLASTGCVEFLAESYSHSLASLTSEKEFKKQIEKHSKLIEKYFNQKPVTFRNTELIYSDKIGSLVADLGFKTMITEGAKHILGWKSPNFVYCNALNPKLKLLLKNFKLSDDIAFRFSEQNWCEWPLTATKFTSWLEKVDKSEDVVNLFLDYETFGEHQWAETGIFDFLQSFPEAALKTGQFKFLTPAEVSEKYQPVGAVKVPNPISWADEERDLTAWLGNELQNEAFEKLYELEEKVNLCHDPEILKNWDYLQTSDHFYYMCTKWFSDGAVHQYFTPYESPYDAFINYMNILSDFTLRVDNATEKIKSKRMVISEEKILTKTELDNLYEFSENDFKKLMDFFPKGRITPLIRGLSLLSKSVELRMISACGSELKESLRKGRKKLKVVKKETEKRQIRTLISKIKQVTKNHKD